MAFNTVLFLFLFLPLTFLLYRLSPSLRVKNIVLIVTGLIFYAFGNPVYVLLMLLSALWNSLLAYKLTVTEDGSKHRKRYLAFGISLNLLLLIVGKYSSWILSSISSLFAVQIESQVFAFPLGLSFFTFKAISCLIDVYRRELAFSRSYTDVLLYLSFFPQLLAGPIVRYKDMQKQIRQRIHTTDDICMGLKRFAFGMAKKVLLSDVLAVFVKAVFSAPDSELSSLSVWFAAIVYMLQIYLDFSGYSDMAIGLSMVFGFQVAENFNYPYVASSIREFWRRWHISLSTWFRDYLYIPLGGNRKGKWRTAFNRCFVFFCTGIWHGASWTFVIWGMIHGFFMLLETFFSAGKKSRSESRAFALLRTLARHLYTLLVVCVSFVLFRAENMTQAGRLLKRMFSGSPLTQQSTLLLLNQYSPLLLLAIFLGILLSMPVFAKMGDFVQRKTQLACLYRCATWGASLILLALCMLSLSGSNYSPFIYFQF